LRASLGHLDQPVRASSRLIASWRRSEDYGVSLEEVKPVFAGSHPEDSLFFECGQEVLTGLHQTLANEPISLMLTNADGVVLNRFSGDTSLLRALDKVFLAPGFAFSERQAGTNGLGLALADRVPTVVRAEEHYSASLCIYTCAAVPVVNPENGRLEGSVNITTWAESSSDLLLALAQSAAGNTSALMLARSHGRSPKVLPRGGVFRVQDARLEPGSGSLRQMSAAWEQAVTAATAAMRDGRVVAAVGESGSGRATLLAQALRSARPHDRILSAASPEPRDVDAWLALWTPELGKDHTAVIIGDVDLLPAWAADELHHRVSAAAGSVGTGRTDALVWSLTAENLADVPEPLRMHVDTVVQVPPLRERPDDIFTLARYAAFHSRGREIEFTVSAEHALRDYGWPGNIDELFQAVQQAAARTDVIDTHHLPAELLAGSSHRLNRIESFERDEIVRCLRKPETTVKDAAVELGMSRATLYRKMAHYKVRQNRQ
jgi:transcriptional regulator of acetoin/glycerol metabolism